MWASSIGQKLGLRSSSAVSYLLLASSPHAGQWINVVCLGGKIGRLQSPDETILQLNLASSSVPSVPEPSERGEVFISGDPGDVPIRM